MNICKPEDNLCLAALSWLHILLLCAGMYLMTSLLYQTKSPAALLAGALWLILPIILSWVWIRIIHSLIVYLLCAFLLCAFLARASHSFLTVALAIVILTVRCFTRIKKGKLRRLMLEMPGEAGAQLSRELWEIPTFLDRPIPAHWALFALYYVIFLTVKKQELLRWVFFLLLADVFVCFIFSYLDNMWRFIRENQKIANLPVHSIQRVGRILLLISVILLGVITLPSVLYNREPLTGLQNFIKPVKVTPSTELPEEMPDNFDGADLRAIAGEPAEPPAWFLALTNVLMYLIALAAAAVLLFAIYRLCRRALAYFAQDEEDEILFLGTEETDSLHRSARLRGRAGERRGSPNQRIRRFYKKTLRRATQKRPDGWETPSELEAKAGLSANDSTEKLHTLYEKARYSPDGCSDADARSLLSGR